MTPPINNAIMPNEVVGSTSAGSEVNVDTEPGRVGSFSTTTSFSELTGLVAPVTWFVDKVLLLELVFCLPSKTSLISWRTLFMSSILSSMSLSNPLMPGNFSTSVDKLDNLLTEVEKLPGMSGLESDIEDKIDDIKSVRQDIKDVLDGKQKTSSSSNTLSTNQVTGATKPVSQEKEVVVEKLPTLPGSVSTFTSEPAEVEPTTSFGMMALLIGGVIVLIAVIVFLLALLLA